MYPGWLTPSVPTKVYCMLSGTSSPVGVFLILPLLPYAHLSSGF